MAGFAVLFKDLTHIDGAGKPYLFERLKYRLLSCLESSNLNSARSFIINLL